MDDPINSVKQLISEVSEERLLQLQQLSLYYATDIDWTAHHSRVLENLLQESYFIPCRSFEESVCFFQFLNDEIDNCVKENAIVNFIIQKLKNNHTFLKKYTN